MVPFPDEIIDNIFFAGLLTTHTLTILSVLFPRFTLFFAPSAHRTRKLGFCLWLLVSLTVLVGYGLYTDVRNNTQPPEAVLIFAALLGAMCLTMSGLLIVGWLLHRKPHSGVEAEQEASPVISGGNNNGKVVD